MHIGSSQNNFKKRRKDSVNLKPVNPVSLKSDALTTFLKNISCCFGRKEEAIDAESGNGNSVTVVRHSNLTVSQKEQQDITPLLREITTNFFENNYYQYSKDTHQRLDKNKSESSLCTFNPISCRRKKSKRLSKNSIVNNTNSDVGLEAARQCISASAFLTTSFFSLSHKPEYSTYPIHINLHYAEDHPADSNKSSQYCEKDFEEINKNAKTSTRGLQCFSDNSTQSGYMSDYVDYLAENITQKVAHFFEITPPKKTKVKQQREKAIFISERVNKATSASIPSPPEEEPTLLYVNSIKHFVSTDDTTVESKLGFDDDHSKINYRGRTVLRPHTTRPLLTKNCCTSTSETCICSEMCPKFKEWYEFLQNNMRNHNANFRHFGQLKNISSSKVDITNEKEGSETCCFPEHIVKNNGSATDTTNMNKAIDCQEVMRELSELETSFNNYDNYVAERNLLDILNQRYPTFIGFQFNNNESRKLTYSINKKAIPPNRKKRVPKIIIREKKKRSSATNNSKNESESKNNTKQSDSKSRASVMNVATNNVFEIREIIESLLPKDPSKFKTISSEYLERSESNQRIKRLDISNSKQDELLRREVEKIVDELLDEVPSTSRDIEGRSKYLSDFKEHKYDDWNLKDDSSLSSLDIELSSLGENFDSAYVERHAAQTIAPLFHKLKIRTTPKRTHEPNDNVKFHLVEDIKSETFAKENPVIENTNGSCDTSPIKSEREVMQQLNENNRTPSTDKLHKESFYAQIVQKTASAEHPLIRTKLSQSASKSSLNSFMKNLLICLKYNESKSKVQDTHIQCNDCSNNSSNARTSTKKLKSMPLKSSFISTSVSSGTCTDWKERKLVSISAEPEKIDKSNMFSQETSTVGVQVFVAKHVKDKEVPSSFPKHKRKYPSKRDICTQTRPGPKRTPCTHGTSMECESSTYKQKGDTMHPSSANRKVNENGACAEDVGIFSTPMVQEINPTENNLNSNTISKRSDATFDLLFPTVQNNLKGIRRGKSCNLLSSSSNTSSNRLPFKTHSDGTIPAICLITPSLSSSLSQRETKHRFSNQLCKNSSSAIKPALCSDLGSGDIENSTFETPSSEHTILLPQDVKQIVLNVHSTSQTAFSIGENSPSEVPSQMTSPHNSSRNLSTGSNSATKLLYETNDLSERQVPPSEKTLVSAETNPTVEIKKGPEQVMSTLSLSEDYSDDSTESDVYKFKPTEIVVDDMYLERIRHLWLKSGLRQHISRLSNLELKPVHEWRKLALLETEEPVPVLEKLDVESIPTHTEKVRIAQHEPIPDTQKEKSGESLLADMKKEAETLDKCLLPTLFNKLTMLERDRKFEIQLSSSSSEQGDIEPALANVGPSLEKLDNEFIDWVIRLGIPVAKISLREVQTSQEYLPKKGKRRPKIQKDKGCRCDNKTFDGICNEIESSSSVLPKSYASSITYVSPEETKSTHHSELEENSPGRNNYYKHEEDSEKLASNQSSITSETNLKIASKQNHGEPPQFLISKEDIQKEILNILDDVIKKLQHKVQEKTIKLASTHDQKGLKGAGASRSDYCELKKFSVSFKKHSVAQIDEESFAESTETNTTDPHERKPSIIKQLKKYVPSAKHEPVTFDSIDSTYPSNSTSTIEKILGEKLYASCSKAEAKLSRKLGISGRICLYKSCPSSEKRYMNANKVLHKLKVQIKNKMDNTKSAATQIKTSTSSNGSDINQLMDKYWLEKCYCDFPAEDIKNQNIFTIKSNYGQNRESTRDCLNSFLYASGHDDLGIQHQREDSRISKDCCLCLYDFDKLSRKRNVRNASQRKNLQNRCKRSSAYRLSDKIQTENMCPAFNHPSHTWNNSIRFAENIENSTTARSVRKTVSNKRNPDLDEDLRECLLFAITSLTKLLTKFCVKFNCSDLVNYYSDIKSQICNRNISISSLGSSTQIIGSVSRPREENILSITKGVPSGSKSETSSTGYFSDSSFASKTSNMLPIRTPSVNYNGNHVIRADNIYSFDYNTGKNINSSNTSTATNTSKETKIRRSLDDFFYNVLYSSSRSELSNNSNKSYTEIPSEACRSTNSFVDSKWSKVHLLIQQYKTCMESKELSSSETRSYSNTSHFSKISGNSLNGFDYSNYSQVIANYPKPSPSNDSLDPDEADDVWEIIKLLSKLCPRVLCKYYVKRILS